MNDNSLEYAQMIEIPVNTCTVTHKKGAKRKKRAPQDLKKKLVEKVNRKVSEIPVGIEQQASAVQAIKPKGKLNIVMLEFVVVCALCAVIFLTNIFVPQSGINTFLRNTFMSGDTTEKYKTYSEYDASAPVLNYSALQLEEGVMTFAGSASLYAPLDGKISAITTDSDGRYILEIAHTDSFKTVISGASFAYYKVGDSIYSTIPVAYVKDGTANFYMYDNGTLLSNYTLQDGSIVWQV